MRVNVAKELAVLRQMNVKELRRKHVELFGEDNRSRHKEYLVRRLIWRIQELAEGGMSERAMQRAAELAKDTTMRTTAPREPATPAQAPHRTKPAKFANDYRVPLPGSVITRDYKGRSILVKVLPAGFEYEGEFFETLSAVATAVTGSHWNGYLFFGLARKEKSA